MIAADAVASCSGCGIDYTPATFAVLPLPRRTKRGGKGDHKGIQATGIPGYHFELRNCACGSTIAAAFESATGGGLTSAQWVEVERRFDATPRRFNREAWQALTPAEQANMIRCGSGCEPDPSDPF